MAIKTLDALAIASMNEQAQIHRIAAFWCRSFKGRAPYNRSEVVKWVKAQYGPILDAKKRKKISKLLLDEIKRQIRIRSRRSKNDLLVDPLDLPLGAPLRMGRLLQSRLGPARLWVSQNRMMCTNPSQCHYIDGDFYSGLVAGLIPLQMRLRNISNPNLLVYRYRGSEPRTRFVANHITTVADAFIWLIPEDAADFLQLPGTRIEHDGESQTVKLTTQFGSKTLPWKKLVAITR
jgi:hypothetical protein